MRTSVYGVLRNFKPHVKKTRDAKMYFELVAYFTYLLFDRIPDKDDYDIQDMEKILATFDIKGYFPIDYNFKGGR